MRATAFCSQCDEVLDEPRKNPSDNLCEPCRNDLKNQPSLFEEIADVAEQVVVAEVVSDVIGVIADAIFGDDDN